MIDTTMLTKIMKKMKAKRVHGVDWIDSYALKTAGPVIEDSLIHLINLSIKSSKFSARWKPQLIFPLHMKKEKDKLENYRPVSQKGMKHVLILPILLHVQVLKCYVILKVN